MTRISILCACALVAVGCGDPHIDYTDNNDNGNANVNNADPVDPQPDVPWVDLDISSSSKLAYVAQDSLETMLMEVTFTSADCAGGRPGFMVRVPRNSAVAISAAVDLTIKASSPVKVLYLRQNSSHDYSFWNLQFLIGEFYDNDPQWTMVRFPTSLSQMGGIRRFLSGFVCAMGYNMVTSDCQDEFPKEFFVDRGTTQNTTIVEADEDEGEIFAYVRVE